MQRRAWVISASPSACGPVLAAVLIATPSQQQLIERADRYIAAHYREPLRMPDLARHCHVSVRTLQNLFVLQRGEPPLKALRRFRLRQLHAQVLAHPKLALRQHYAHCGLIGSAADRAFFLELYGLSVREHQLASRHRLKRLPPPQPSSTAQAA